MHSDQTIQIYTDAGEQRRAVTSLDLFTDLNQSYRHVLSERRSLFVSHVGYSRGTHPPFFNLYKEMAISKQSTLSVSRGYLLFVRRGTIQIPSAVPLNPTSKMNHFITTKCNYSHRFLQRNSNLNFTLHQKLTAVHLSWSLESGLRADNVGLRVISPSGLGAKGGQSCR